jgi:hypothetical protein
MQGWSSVMRTSLLCAWLVLGTSIAIAEPPKTAPPAPPVRQTMTHRPEAQRGRLTLQDRAKKAVHKRETVRVPGEWVELADPTPAKHGTEFVVVGAQQGAFSQLRINAAKGRVMVRTVRVDFSDGTSKTTRLGKAINERGRKFAQVDLGTAKPIAQVIVTTDRQGGEYEVYGSSGLPTTVVSSR